MKRMHLIFNDETGNSIRQLKTSLNVPTTSAVLSRLVHIGLAMSKLKDKDGFVTLVNPDGETIKIIL